MDGTSTGFLAEGHAYKPQKNIPYRSKLTEKIEPGQTLIIRGRTPEEAKRFNINLHKDSPDFSGNDVPLHVSVRFDEGKCLLLELPTLNGQIVV
ncbi:hypothetical protein ANCCEY_09269 [Ancylostoma ceylanicum]|uniref:Galectin n=1 Tax=Ancylostoma ceylanicum TaxID=53326 RepID=A0A0D6LKD2_9BILA|nr:hypothetical protein ANCCEY_09269 [Ancylostoma ceylanicum]